MKILEMKIGMNFYLFEYSPVQLLYNNRIFKIKSVEEITLRLAGATGATD